jgi:hypothetical protein
VVRDHRRFARIGDKFRQAIQLLPDSGNGEARLPFHLSEMKRLVIQAEEKTENLRLYLRR